MDTHQRIEAVRRRLREMQIDERAAELAGPPCSGCLYLLNRETKWPRGQAAYCGHMAYTERSFDPTAGKFIESNETLTSAARLPEGLCGVEAVLFEPKDSKIAVAGGKIMTGVAAVWGILMLVLVVWTIVGEALRA